VTSDEPDLVVEAKRALRAEVLGRRRARPTEAVAAARAAILAALVGFVEAGATVCAYLPLPTEPLPVELPAELTARGCRLLLPRAQHDRPLDWCGYGSGTRTGTFGIEEPVGPSLGPDAVCSADLVLVPALAVDQRGYRLGRGGGHYDRTLGLVCAVPGGWAGRAMAVVFDDERVPQVPVGPFDVPIGYVITPANGVRSLAG
jgi:5-formyltetrahydrofolate cyclo-ligase